MQPTETISASTRARRGEPAPRRGPRRPRRPARTTPCRRRRPGAGSPAAPPSAPRRAGGGAQAWSALIQHPLQPQHAHLPVDRLVHGHHGGEGAAPQTDDALEVVLAVRRGLPGAHLQPALEGLQHLDAALDVAGGAEADAQPVTTGRSEAKLGVEGSDAEDVALGELEPASDASHGVGRQVAERAPGLAAARARGRTDRRERRA
jgi:hypothetical protein